MQVIQEVGGEIPVEFVSSILAADSLAVQLRFVASSSLQQKCMEILQAFLGLKNVLLLEEAYKYVSHHKAVQK